MICPLCKQKQTGWDYLFCERYGQCFDCISKEASGACPEVPIEMANEILSEFAKMPIKWKHPE
jgi:hypothetical protein